MKGKPQKVDGKVHAKTCKLCNKPYFAKNLCEVHYMKKYAKNLYNKNKESIKKASLAYYNKNKNKSEFKELRKKHSRKYLLKTYYSNPQFRKNYIAMVIKRRKKRKEKQK